MPAKPRPYRLADQTLRQREDHGLQNLIQVTPGDLAQLASAVRRQAIVGILGRKFREGLAGVDAPAKLANPGIGVSRVVVDQDLPDPAQFRLGIALHVHLVVFAHILLGDIDPRLDGLRIEPQVGDLQTLRRREAIRVIAVVGLDRVIPDHVGTVEVRCRKDPPTGDPDLVAQTREFGRLVHRGIAACLDRLLDLRQHDGLRHVAFEIPGGYALGLQHRAVAFGTEASVLQEGGDATNLTDHATTRGAEACVLGSLAQEFTLDQGLQGGIADRALIEHVRGNFSAEHARELLALGPGLLVHDANRDLLSVDLGRHQRPCATEILTQAPEGEWNGDQANDDVGKPAGCLVTNRLQHRISATCQKVVKRAS